MHKGVKRYLSCFIVICILMAQIYFSSPAFAYTARLYGTDRYRTAIAISQQGWSSSNYAVLARGDDFPDALCAGPLAKAQNAPILLTEPWRLNPDVLTELRRLGVSYVYIIGGTGAVSQDVEYALRSAGIYNVERIYGSDRHETSVRIAEKMGWPGTIALATGENFPDALSISAIAAKKGMPILLTGKYNLPYSVDQYIRNRSISKTYVVGGTGVISEGVRTTVPNAVRLAGTDRFDTNMQIMKYFESELDFNNLYVAIGDGPTGDEFADALTGAVLAAKTASPLVLTGNTLPWVTSNYIRPKVSSVTKVTALGGEGVVPWSVVNSITNYTNNTNNPGGLYSNVSATYNTAGTYGPYNGTNTVSGSVVISASDVTLQNTIIEGDLTLTENIYTGSVYLRNVTVRGTTYVRGGGPNSVVMTDFNSNYVVAEVPNNTVRLLAQGNTNIGNLRMDCGGKLEEYSLSGNGFSTVVIPDSVSVTMYGRFDTVYMESSSASLYLESGSINTLNVSSAAYSSNINVSNGTYVDTMTLEAATTVYGQGQIYRANVNSSGTYIERSPSTIVVRDGISANVGGQYVTGTSSSGSSYTSTISLSRVSSLISIDAYDSYSAYTNINNPNSASLSYSSNNANVTIDSSGTITSATPGASAVITVTGTKSGWNGSSTSFTINISSDTAKVSDNSELAGALSKDGITAINLAANIMNLTGAVGVTRGVTIDGQGYSINAGLNITGSSAVVKNLKVTMAPASPATTLTTAKFGNYTNGSRRAAIWVGADNVKLQGIILNVTDDSTIYASNNTVGQGIAVNDGANVEISNCSITMHDTNIVGGVPQYNEDFVGIYLSNTTSATVTTNTIVEGSYGIGVDTSDGATGVSFKQLTGNKLEGECLKSMYIVGADVGTDYTTTVTTVKVPGSSDNKSAKDLVLYFRNNNTTDVQKLYKFISEDKSIIRNLKVLDSTTVQPVITDADGLRSALTCGDTSIVLDADITDLTTKLNVPNSNIVFDGQGHKINAGLNITGLDAIVKNLKIEMAPVSSSTTITTAMFGNYTQGFQRAVVWVDANNVKLQNLTLNITDHSAIYETESTIGKGIAVNQKSGVEIGSCSITMHDTNIVSNVPQYKNAFIGIYLSHATNATVTTNTIAEAQYGIGVDVVAPTSPPGDGPVLSFTKLSRNTIGDACVRPMFIFGKYSNTDYITDVNTINIPGSSVDKSAEDLILYFQINNFSDSQKLYKYLSSDSSIDKNLRVSGIGTIEEVVD